jgi:hypothetical protein
MNWTPSPRLVASIRPRPGSPGHARALVAVGVTAMASVVVAIGAAPPAAALGSVLYVAQAGTNAGDCTVAASPCATVSYALTQAAPAATINVSGTIHDNVDTTGHSGITITGVNAPVGSPAIIDGSAAGRVIIAGGNLALDHLTLQNGTASGNVGGAGLYASYVTTTLTNVTVTNNHSSTGGGGIANFGDLTITNSTISSNTSAAPGYGGGGILVEAGTLQLTNSTISANSSDNGGAIAIGTGSSSFAGNVTLTNSTVSGNSAGTRGGAVYVRAQSALTVRTSTLSGNTATYGGGIEMSSSTTTNVTSSAISGNNASFGGGIDNVYGTVNIAGSIVAGNGPYDDCSNGAVGGSATINYSLIGSGSCGPAAPGVGNVSGDPLLAPLGNNGGPTRTMALSLESPAANAIPVGATGNGVTLCARTDQTGVAAPVPSQGACAMGAVEANAVLTSVQNTLYVAAGGSNAGNDCTAKATPCATVTYALTQIPPLAGTATIKLSGTISDHVDIPAGRTIVITGQGAASPAVIDGGSSGAVMYNDAGANLRLSYVTLQHGSVTGYGGGLSWSNGSAVLSHVTVKDSTSGLGGGGIIASGGSMTITDSAITGNVTGLCGGCLNMKGGGGIWVNSSTNVSITNTTISGNTSQGGGSGYGGGISQEGSTLITVTGSTISGNAATHRGGGISGQNMAIRNSTITGNTAVNQGGGIVGGGGSQITITGSTIAGNSTTNFAGEDIQTDGTVTYAASIISGTGNGHGNCSGSLVSTGYNVTSDNTCGTTTTGDLQGVNPNLGGLANNGGPTLTMLPSAGSPAIGKIPSGTTLNSVSACPRTDQRGLAGPSTGQTQCTIGAVEVAAGTAPGFTSAASTSVLGGTRFTFAVTTSSTIPATLSVNPATPLPAGVTFVDQGDNTGTLSGFANPGTYPFTLQATNGVAPNASQAFTLTVNKRQQLTLTLTSVNGTFGASLPLTTSGGSGSGAVTYMAVNGTATGCAVSGSGPYTLGATSAGTCTVTATKAADSDFQARSSAATTVTFAKAAQATLTVTSVSGTYGTPLTLTTSGGSGTGAVTYVAAEGTATGCAVSASAPYTLSVTSAGTCIVTATKAADTNYNASSSAPTTVTFGKAGQATLTVTSVSGTYGTPLTLTTSGGSGTGAVTYVAADGTATGCTVSASAPYTLSVTSAGTCTVTATKAADGNYTVKSSAPTTVTFAKATQATLTLTSVSGTYGTPLTLTTSGGSGAGAVTYVGTNGTATGCAANGSTLTSTSAGTCTVTATKAADGNYNATSSAPTTVTFAKGAQATLTLTSVSGTYGTPLALTTSGGSGAGAVTYAATNGTATGCAANGSTLTSTSAGTCTVTATKAADTNYKAASSAPTTVTFAKAAQATLTVTSVSGTYGTPLTLTTSGGSGTGAVTYVAADGTATGCTVSASAPYTLSVTSAGTCTVTATKAADGNYTVTSSAPTTITFAKAGQSIVFTSTAPSPAYVSGPAYTITATGGGSGNPVTFTLDATSTGCELNGSTLTFVAAGTCVVNADQAGDANYNPALQVLQSFTVATDSFAPTVLITDKPANPTKSTTATFSFTGSDQQTPPVSFTCKLDDAAAAACTSPMPYSGLADGVHTFTVQGSDNAGNASAPVAYSWRVDTHAPTAAVTSPAAATSTTIPTTLSGSAAVAWTAADTGGSGVANYQVRYARAPSTGALGAWSYPSSWTGLTVKSVKHSGLAKGYVYCYSVRATDRAGNNSDWSPSGCIAVPLDDASLKATTSGWTRGTGAAYWNGTTTSTKTMNATLSRPNAQLARVGIVATRCSTCGIVGIYVGGTLMGQINLHAATTEHRKVLLLPKFSYRTGTVTLKVLTRGKLVSIDGLMISRF